MVRICGETFWRFCPCPADDLVGCEAAEAFEATGEVVGGDEVVEIPSQLIVVFVVEALDRGVLDGAVHVLDLTIRPRAIDLDEAVLDAVFLAPHGEHVGHISSRRAVH